MLLLFNSAGLFNVGNKLLVSLDLLFAIRNQIKLGEDPRVSISTVLKSVQEQTGTGCRSPFAVLVLSSLGIFSAGLRLKESSCRRI